MAEFVRNDTQFDINFTVVDSDGTAVDLTDGTILFKMATSPAHSAKISSGCTIVSAVAGTCKYAVQDGDLDTAGRYKAELQITYTSNKVITAVLDDITVVEDLTT